jgi:hypothetical protein
MTLFDEILTAAKTKGAVDIKPNETDDKYLEEIIRVIAIVDNPVWEGLSTDAKTWFNESVKAINLAQPLPEIDGFVRRDSPKEIAPNSPIAVKTKTGAKSIFAPPSKKRNSNAVGVIEATRRIALEHEDWTISQIHSYLIINGYPDAKKDTVNVSVSDMKKVIQLLTSLGRMNTNATETTGTVVETVSESDTTEESESTTEPIE